MSSYFNEIQKLLIEQKEIEIKRKQKEEEEERMRIARAQHVKFLQQERQKKLEEERNVILEIENAKFKEVYENKNILLIGPSKNLFNELKHVNLNQYDFIVGLNWHYKECWDKIKFDAIYWGGNSEHYTIQDLEELKEKNINLFYRIDIHNFKHEQIAQTFQERNKDVQIPYYVIPDNIFRRYTELLKCNPSTGTLAIFHILLWKPKKLSVIGFDFYETLYHNQDDDEFLKELREGKYNHCPLEQFVNFKELIKEYNNFEALGRLKEKLNE